MLLLLCVVFKRNVPSAVCFQQHIASLVVSVIVSAGLIAIDRRIDV